MKRQEIAALIKWRVSMSDYRKEDWLTNLPLYAIREVTKIVEA